MNLNNKIALLAIGLSLGHLTLFAQSGTASGIYLNAHDYAENKLSFSFNCSSSGKIKLNDFISSNYLAVIAEGKKIRLNKDSIFGYSNCKNETYRFYKSHDEEFRILESKDIVLYSSYVRISSNNGKINKLVLSYFFSRTDSSEILPLTMENLKRAYPDNLKFHDMLDVEFGNGEPLTAFSANDNMYKVNYLFNKSTLK